jgi:hypothetical protein
LDGERIGELLLRILELLLDGVTRIGLDLPRPVAT